MNSIIWIISLLAALAIIVIVFRKRKSTPEDSEQSSSMPIEPGASGALGAPGASGPVTEPAKPAKPAKAAKESASVSDDDRAVLEQLRAAGSDLGKPHQIDFYLYFATEQAAQQAAEKLEAEGYEGEMRMAPDLTRWMCMVREEMVPEPSKIGASKRRFAKLAQEFGGEYDGWETNVVK
jgi:hypothetical protein